MKKKTQKPKYLLHYSGWAFIWQKRESVIEKVASWMPIDIADKRIRSKFSILKHYQYVCKADKKELLESFVRTLRDSRGWKYKCSYITCRDMSNAEVDKFAKTLIK